MGSLKILREKSLNSFNFIKIEKRSKRGNFTEETRSTMVVVGYFYYQKE